MTGHWLVFFKCPDIGLSGSRKFSLWPVIGLFGSCKFSHSLVSTDQPISRLHNLRNWSCARGLVNISAICSKVEICSMEMVSSIIWERKWCKQTERCFVRGRVLWLVAISIQLLLSLKVWHLTTGIKWLNQNFRDLSSFSRFNTEITSRNEEDSAIYSASVVLK